MGFEVRINNIPITVLSYNRVNDLCEGIGKIKLEVDSNLNVSIGDTITLYENNVKKGEYFLKEISNVVEDGKKIIDGQDDSWKLENYFIAENITVESANTNLYYIEWLLNQADVDYSIDVSTSESQYVEIGTSLGMTMAMDLLKDLCRYSGWYFWFDANNTCHISKIKTSLSNISAVFDDSSIISLESRKDDKMLRNRGLVYGGANLQTGGYIIGEQTRYTGFEYDERDLRTVVYSNANMSYQASATRLARQLVDEFAKITHTKIVTLAGYYDLKINDVVYINSQYYSGACLIMNIESSASASGELTILTLDSRCPKLVTYFEHDFVYIGTFGQGVWRKSISVPSAEWENYSTGIQSTDLYIKDLKIYNGLFVCIGGDSVYYRTYNTSWIKLNIPEDYLDYVPTGIAIDKLDSTFYAVYTNYTQSIEVKANFYGSILNIGYVKLETGEDIVANDIDLYGSTPIITTGNLATIPDPEGQFISLGNQFHSAFAFVSTYCVVWDENTINDSVIRVYDFSNIETPFNPIKELLVSVSARFVVCTVLDSNTIKFVLSSGSSFLPVIYNIVSNTAEIGTSTNIPSEYVINPTASPLPITINNILVTSKWFFNAKTGAFVPLKEWSKAIYYHARRKIVLLRVYNRVTVLGPGYPWDNTRQEQVIEWQIIDIETGTYTTNEYTVFDVKEGNTDKVIEFFVTTNAMYFTEAYYYNYYMALAVQRKYYLQHFFFGFPTGRTLLSHDKAYVIIDLRTSNVYKYDLTSEELTAFYSWQSMLLFERSGWIVDERYPYSSALTASGRKTLVLHSITIDGSSRTFVGEFDIFTRQLDLYINTSNFTSAPPNIHFTGLLDHRVFYAGTTRSINGNNNLHSLFVSRYLGGDFETNDDREQVTLAYLIHSGVEVENLSLVYVNNFAWILHVRPAQKAIMLRVDPSTSIQSYFYTIKKNSHENYSIIDAYLDLDVLENSQDGAIIAYPFNTSSPAYPESLRVGFVPEFGNFITVTGTVKTSLSESEFISDFSDLRSYYQNPDYYGFSQVSLSGTEDNFLVSAVVSGSIKTTGIDLLDDFVSVFSGVTKIETSNYSDYYFYATSGNGFYQKIYPNTTFSLAINNIPSSPITIIRLDDRL